MNVILLFVSMFSDSRTELCSLMDVSTTIASVRDKHFVSLAVSMFAVYRTEVCLVFPLLETEVCSVEVHLSTSVILDRTL